MQINIVGRNANSRSSISYLFMAFIAILLVLSSCDKDDDPEPMVVDPAPIGQADNYTLTAKNSSGVSGAVEFQELDDNSTRINITVSGTSAGNMHPAHVHANTAAEGGGIIISLNPVDGATGTSSTVVTALEDGTALSFSDVMSLDAYVNIHLSADDLATVVAQGDIGQNVLTANSKEYPLNEKDAAGISGSIKFTERLNGEALAEIQLAGTPADGMHPAHIHANTAAEGGAILLSLNPVIGASGFSATNISADDSGAALDYDAVLALDAYVNVHLSADALGTIVGQGDIGVNELTGNSKTYKLNEKDAPSIKGTLLLEERLNGLTLATISLDNTVAGTISPAHIHANTALETGGILVTLTSIDGATGLSQTTIRVLDDGTAITYDELLAIDGYVNVHLSASALATIIAQGDIGANELTGDTKEYVLNTKDVAGISGNLLFEKRVNGTALATISLIGTVTGGLHPAHIHANDAATGGEILVTLASVIGETGISQTNVFELDDNTALTYDDILSLDGYVNVHLSAAALSTIVAQGDIGANAN